MKPRRSHTFSGCKTCRKRHVKCDLTLPQCQRCQVAGRLCDFEPSFRWLVSTGADVYERHLPTRDELQYSRRHLFTNQSREFMSLALVNGLHSSVSSALNDIDERSERLRGMDRHDVGPFSVFRAGMSEESIICDQSTLDDHGQIAEQAASQPVVEASLFADQISFNDQSASLDFLQWDDLFTGDLDLDDLGANTSSTHCQPEFNDCLEELDLGDAPMLLKHFNDDVIQQMGSLPVKEKSSWRNLNFTSALVTLSQLRLLEMPVGSIKYASLANLYALVAVSSFHLSLNSARFPDMARTGSYWASFWPKAYTLAKKYLKVSLETERQGPSKAKYKDQLMATAATLGVALLSGNESDASRYLNEMERIIRKRGLTKPKVSRRARLLHNVYAWMRIVSESTHVLERSSERAQIHPDCYDNQAQEDSTMDNFLQLEPWHMGAQDIHLANSSDDTENMYMQIYGVPETWLRLVSQITRLANMMDRLQPRQRRFDAELLAALQPKASQLEDAVCNFHDRYKTSPVATPHDHMVRALSASLVIFFYRRIRDISSDLMQDNVSHVIQSLHAFDDSLKQCGLPGPGTAWPAFIAGSEASSAQQRHQLREWLQTSFNKSGWRGYELSIEILSEVWSARDSGGNATSWVDVCRNQKLWPLLC